MTPEFSCMAQLPEGKHQVKVEVIKDGANALLKSWDYIVYSKGKK